MPRRVSSFFHCVNESIHRWIVSWLLWLLGCLIYGPVLPHACFWPQFPVIAGRLKKDQDISWYRVIKLISSRINKLRMLIGFEHAVNLDPYLFRAFFKISFPSKILDRYPIISGISVHWEPKNRVTTFLLPMRWCGTFNLFSGTAKTCLKGRSSKACARRCVNGQFHFHT